MGEFVCVIIFAALKDLMDFNFFSLKWLMLYAGMLLRKFVDFRKMTYNFVAGAKM